jgi:hypothetical protein
MTPDEQMKEITSIAGCMRATAITRRLLGIAKSSDYVHSNIKRILRNQQLPYHSQRRSLDGSPPSGSLNLGNPELRSKLYTAIQKIHGELQPIVFYHIDEISDGENQFNPERTYKISRLLEYHAELWKKRTGDRLSTRILLKKYDQTFRHNLAVYNSLIDTSNINEVTLSRFQKRRLQNVLGKDGDPRKNFRNMKFISIDNPHPFQSKRDVALFFSALYNSDSLFMFDNKYIGKRDQVLLLIKLGGYYIFPYSHGDEKCILTKKSLISALNHVSRFDKNLLGKRNQLKNQINTLVEHGRTNDFIPALLQFVEKS